MIAFSVETWVSAYAEMSQLFTRNWKEIDNNHGLIPLDLNLELYALLETMGKLHVIVVRDGGTVVGYCVTLVTEHIRYKNILHAMSDFYYLLPEYRTGRNGLNFIKYIQAELKKTGAKKLIISSRYGKDKIFDYLGYSKVETVHTLLL